MDEIISYGCAQYKCAMQNCGITLKGIGNKKILLHLKEHEKISRLAV